jgi:diguanylate cyclase (GGDEF)-like protein
MPRIQALRLLPLARGLGPAGRRVLATAWILLLATMGLAALHTLFGVGGKTLHAPIRDLASSVAYVLVAVIVWMRVLAVGAARTPWIVLATGITLYGAGNVLWVSWLQALPEPPIPSLSDGLWLSLYPLAYIGVVKLALTGVRRVSAGVWLDGLIAGLGICAIGATLVFRPVLDAATGPAQAVATNLAYPIADLILVALVLGLSAVRGWRFDVAWAAIGGGFMILAAADVIYLLQVASGALESSMVANLFYMLGVALLAAAAWQRPSPAPRPLVERWSVLIVPGAAFAGALALLVVDHFDQLHPLAFGLAILTLAASLVRTALTFRDVRALATTRRQALTDDLTALPNLRLFRIRLDQAIDEARDSGGSCALLVIDADRFKELNDTLGHQAGDIVLRQIAPRLSEGLRAIDTVARIGGDEFGLVLRGPIDEQGAVAVADAVRAAMERPFVVGDLSLHMPVSIGIALYPEHGDRAGELQRRADVAMYRAKSMGTGRESYQSEFDAGLRDRLTLVGDLKTAIGRGEIEVHYQPVADAHTRRVAGVEALARWCHDVHGPIGPDVFVPLAEEAGLARDLTRHVLGVALDQCRSWRDRGFGTRVSVNLSAPDLHDSALPDQVFEALTSRGLPAELLVLEITETSVLTDPVRISRNLARLAEMGIGLSLDDFGTGYSSLTRLKTLPVGELKIDRSFVADMATDPADAAIVGSTIQLAHSLHMRVVGEGVEDERTWRQLAELGCELVQGYALSRPMPAGELEPMLREVRGSVPPALLPAG